MMKKLVLLLFLTQVCCNNLPISSNEIPKDLLITLKRSGCYAAANACPIYDLTVKADGSVVFEGKDLTKIKGKVEDKITEEKLRQLIGEFQNADYFNLENSYDENCPQTATDRPGVNISLQMNGKQKSVYHYLGCYKGSEVFPPQLFELENKIDEIVETKRWVGERK